MELTETTKKKLGIYCRVSSQSQKDNTSLKTQMDKGILYCKNNNYEYEVFKDVVSGSQSNRNGLTQLFTSIYTNQLDGIILYDWDRLQRESKELLITFEEVISKTKCIVVVDNKVTDILENLSDRMFYEMKSSFSSVQRMSITMKTIEGLQSTYERGNYIFGRNKFGYKGVGKKHTLRTVIDDNQSVMVKEIFRYYNLQSVNTYKDVSEHILRKFKKEFTIKQITDILKYEGYVGKGKQTFKNKEYDYEVPQIINKKLFNNTQKKISLKTSQNKGRDKEEQLLKGLIYCSDCGRRLYKKGTKSPNGTSVYQHWYQCSMYKKPQYIKQRIKWENGEKCDKSYKGNYINKLLFEDIVWDSLHHLLTMNSDMKNEFLKKKKDDLKIKNSDIHSKSYYEGKIEEIEDKKFKTYNDYLDGKIREKDYNQFVKRFDVEVKSYTKRITEIDDKIQTFNKMDKVEFESVDELMINKIKQQYKYKSTTDRIRIINKYIDKIFLKRLSDDEYKLTFEILFNLDKSNNQNLMMDDNHPSIIINKGRNTYIKNSILWL